MGLPNAGGGDELPSSRQMKNHGNSMTPPVRRMGSILPGSSHTIHDEAPKG